MFLLSYLDFGFGGEADQHEEQNGDNVVLEAGPVVDFEGGHESTHQHKENRARSKNSTAHQHHLRNNLNLNFMNLKTF